MSKLKKVVILGATGSVGSQSLDVIRDHQDSFEVFGVTANSNVNKMLQICSEFKPKYVVLADTKASSLLKEKLKSLRLKTEVLQGDKALQELSSNSESDIVISAIVGSAGLKPTLAAIEKGKRVLLANKESLVISGSIMMDAADKCNAEILPVDSEHNAIFQCLPSGYKVGVEPNSVSRLILTASGGPFLSKSLTDLGSVTPEQACAHPNWDMGAKISVDSATMMNKGFEVIEAYWLFKVDLEKIEVIVHPQSIVHSMVEYIDGSMIAHMAVHDMRLPIAFGLGWPARVKKAVPSLDLHQLSKLEFIAPDVKRFPCLQYAFDALNAGGATPAMLNAANEVAVAAFLQGQIKFIDISKIIDAVLQHFGNYKAGSLEEIMIADEKARCYADAVVRGRNIG